jgi:RNA polymerase sigma factor (sigma-70 family)
MDLRSLFLTHERELERFFKGKVRGSSDTDDLIQETFLRLARLQDGAGIREPRRFLFTIAANLARDHLRKMIARRVGKTEMLSADIADDGQTPDDFLRSKQEAELAQRAIEALPEKTRAIFLLYHVEGWSYRQIAEELGMSARTVEYHLRQGLASCRLFINHNQ